MTGRPIFFFFRNYSGGQLLKISLAFFEKWVKMSTSKINYMLMTGI